MSTVMYEVTAVAQHRYLRERHRQGSGNCAQPALEFVQVDARRGRRVAVTIQFGCDSEDLLDSRSLDRCRAHDAQREPAAPQR